MCGLLSEITWFQPKELSISYKVGLLPTNFLSVCLLVCQCLYFTFVFERYKIKDARLTSFFLSTLSIVIPLPSGSIVSDERATVNIIGVPL